MIKNLSQVTDADLGQWVAGSTTYTPMQFNVAVIDLAISLGFEIETEAWEEDRPLFIEGGEDVSFDMIEDLGYVFEEAVAWMNSQLPDYFYFDIEDGLCLFHDA